MYASRLDGDDEIEFELGEGRNGWVQVARGSLEFNDEMLSAGDGVAIKGASTLTFRNADKAEVLLFDMA